MTFDGPIVHVPDAGDGPVRDAGHRQRVAHRHLKVQSTPEHDQDHLQGPARGDGGQPVGQDLEANTRVQEVTHLVREQRPLHRGQS